MAEQNGGSAIADFPGGIPDTPTSSKPTNTRTAVRPEPVNADKFPGEELNDPRAGLADDVPPADAPESKSDAKGDTPTDTKAILAKIDPDLKSEAFALGFSRAELAKLGSDDAIEVAVERARADRRHEGDRRGESAPKRAEPEPEVEEPDVELGDNVEDSLKKAVKQANERIKKLAKKHGESEQNFARRVAALVDDRETLEFDLAIASDPDLRQVLGEGASLDLEDDDPKAYRKRQALAAEVSKARAELVKRGVQRIPTISALTKREARKMFGDEIGAQSKEQTQQAAQKHGEGKTALRPSGQQRPASAKTGIEAARENERNWLRKNGML